MRHTRYTYYFYSTQHNTVWLGCFCDERTTLSSSCLSRCQPRPIEIRVPGFDEIPKTIRDSSIHFCPARHYRFGYHRDTFLLDLTHNPQMECIVPPHRRESSPSFFQSFADLPCDELSIPDDARFVRVFSSSSLCRCSRTHIPSSYCRRLPYSRARPHGA